MIGKLRSMINKLRLSVIDFTVLKGMTLALDGNGASDPVINSEFNVLTVIRIGVGIYRITVKQGTVLGVPLNTKAIALLTHTIQPSAVSEAHFSAVSSVSSTEFDINVTEMTVGAGNKLEVNPYDIIAGDGIDIALLLDIGSGRLPPE